MHYGVSPSSRAEERKWWDYGGLGRGEREGPFPPPLCSKLSRFTRSPGTPVPHPRPVKTSTAPDLKIILNQRVTVVSRAQGGQEEPSTEEGKEKSNEVTVFVR